MPIRGGAHAERVGFLRATFRLVQRTDAGRRNCRSQPDAAKSLAWKPGVEMKGRRLDLERRLAQFCQVQIDGVIWCWTNRRWDTGEHRQDRAMNVAGSDQLRARMAFDDGGKLAGIEEKLAVHVCDAGLEWRMVQEQERGPFR